MNKHFYLHIAIDNLKKNKKMISPFFITCIFMTMMFYMVDSLSQNPHITEMIGGMEIQSILEFGRITIAFFVFIFLCYTYSFLMKQRNKEFALFHILGMEKKHIARVILYESLILLVGALGVGCGLGIFFDKAFYLLITRILDAQIELGFYISIPAIIDSICLFTLIYIFIYLITIFRIHRHNPITLLKMDNIGEKEPRSKWGWALLGIICLIIGYSISIRIQNPLSALPYFLLAVILVIIATYLLFMFGSITILKGLRKNKRYYYQTKHFINVSNMMYRMKQNAVGLANICIMSTMVLVMLSSTISLWAGIQDAVNDRYPRDISLSMSAVQPQTAIQEIYQVMEEGHIDPVHAMAYNSLQLRGIRHEETFDLNISDKDMDNLEDVYVLVFIPIDNLNQSLHTQYQLEKDEVYLYSKRVHDMPSQIQLEEYQWQVKGQLDEMVVMDSQMINVAHSLFVIVDSMDTLTQIYNLQSDVLQYDIETKVLFDVSKQETRSQEELIQAICMPFSQNGHYPKGYIGGLSKATNAHSFTYMYGGLLFIGIFLSVLFVVAMILIMYYKQISEGLQDRKRFEIMQKVGLDQRDVKKVINSQVLTVFFLPLVVAGVHILFAFPIIEKLLRLFSLSNAKFYMEVTLLCFAAFAFVYIIIYIFTSKTYYRIVQQKNAFF